MTELHLFLGPCNIFRHLVPKIARMANLKSSAPATRKDSTRWILFKTNLFCLSNLRFHTTGDTTPCTRMRATYELVVYSYKTSPFQQNDQLATDLYHWKTKKRYTTRLYSSAWKMYWQFSFCICTSKVHSHHPNGSWLAQTDIEISRCRMKTWMVAALSTLTWLRWYALHRYQASGCRYSIEPFHGWHLWHSAGKQTSRIVGWTRRQSGWYRSHRFRSRLIIK